MAQAPRDENRITTLLGTSNADGVTPVVIWADPVTHRLLVDLPGGSGSVTSVSVVSANGLAGTVATATSTPAITLSTTVTGLLKGNGTAISAASAGSDYVAPGAVTTSGLTQATARILGRTTASTGAVEEISVGAGLTLSAGSLVATGVASSMVVGTTAITSGTNTRILYNNSGVLGEYTLSGSGTVVAMATSPVLTTPNIGVATATSVNGLTITSSTGTLTITNLKTLAVTNTLTLSGTDSTIMTFPTTSKTIAANDGSNLTIASQAIGDLLTASSTTAYTRIAAVATGQVLVSAGTGTAPAYSANPQVTTIELGNASDTTLSRSAGGILAVEGVDQVNLSASQTLTNKTLTSPILQTSPVLAAATSLKFTVPSGDGTGTGITTNEFNSGYSSTAIGDLVYLDSSATWQKADADASAATYSSLLGIALTVTASGAAATVLLQGFVYAATPFPTFTIGAPVYMSATAGAVTQTAPTTTDSATRIIGYAVHADKMWFNPSNDWITHA